MIRVTETAGDGSPFVRIYAVAESELTAAVAAVEQRTDAPNERIDGLSRLNGPIMDALGLKTGEIAVLSATNTV